MKKIIILLNCMLCLSSILQAQISGTRSYTVTKKIDTAKIQTLRVNPENTYVKPLTPLPDLKLSTLGFSLVSTQIVDGVAKHTFQINYTVKNEGNLSVAANTVFLQGYISFTGANPRTIAGCGTVVRSLAGEMINAGDSYSGFYRCTAPFDRNNPPLYKLYLDSDNIVKESNEENNFAQMTILF